MTIAIPVLYCAGVTPPKVNVSAILIIYAGPNQNQTSNSVTAGVSGGQKPYSHDWTFDSGGAGISIGTPTLATTDATTANMNPMEYASGYIKDTVKDLYGQEIVSQNVECFFYRYGNGVIDVNVGEYFGSGYQAYGCDPNLSIGSIISSNITFGTPTTLYTDDTSGSQNTYLVITAGSDPGQNAFYAIETSAGTVILFSAKANSYIYSGGAATWFWHGGSFFTTGPGTATVSVL